MKGVNPRQAVRIRQAAIRDIQRNLPKPWQRPEPGPRSCQALFEERSTGCFFTVIYQAEVRADAEGNITMFGHDAHLECMHYRHGCFADDTQRSFISSPQWLKDLRPMNDKARALMVELALAEEKA